MMSLLKAGLPIFKVVKLVHSSPWEMVEVTLASEYSDSNAKNHALDDFNDLFDEFAQQQGIRLHRGNFREIQSFINGLPVAKYGLRGVDCEQFRKFLSGVKAQKYHLKYAAVKCGPMTFSFCMAFSCTPEDFYGTTTTTTSKATITY
ncbi:hypothetical protein Y032_0240g3341 [Ancylostoma ceylanicum]|uniref:Uncharacterized protein n=1 Tax=Ancylostoma ceylanicum TaxID=53326 RepID=A0A016SEM7_9BILA|nr:hypothetical protein Y032_0240g3341 [Ancylostoma ceylanicum]